MHKLIRTIAAVLAVGSLGVEAHAAGTKQTENSATGMGMADARVGIVDEPSAVYYNPAAMTQLENSAVSLGIVGIFPQGEFTARTDLPQGVQNPELRAGETVDADIPVSPLPHLYGVHKLPDSGVAIGLGVFIPFATSPEWPDNWAGRAAGERLRVLALAINPNIAWEIVPGLSIAGGFSLIQSSLEIERTIRGSIGDPGEDIGVEIAADGQGYQGNAAILWRAHDMVSVGVSYRTAIKVDMDGEVDFTLPNATYAGLFPDQDVSTSFRFPDTVNAGIGIFPTEDLKIDAEIEFNRWNVVRQLVIDFEEGVPSQALVTQQDWENEVAYRLGADYMGSSKWNFRGGIAWDPSPTPKNRRSPISPDSDRIVTGLGATYHWKAHEFALGLQWQHFIPRGVGEEEIAEGAADLPGDYQFDTYLAGLTWTYNFR